MDYAEQTSWLLFLKELNDMPMFWACGVTPQAAVMEARPELAIGHAPGHLRVTDAGDSDYLVP